MVVGRHVKVRFKARISEVRALCSDGMLWMRIWKTAPVLTWMRAAEAFRTGNYSKAVEYYRRGLSKYPSHPAHFSARYDLAFCLEKLGCLEEAIQEISYIISLRTEIKDAYLFRSRLLMYIGKYSYALESLRIARSIFPEDILILVKYFHLAIDVGNNLEEVEKIREELLRLSKSIAVSSEVENYKEIQIALAHYELFRGDEIKGDQFLNKVIAEGQVNLYALLLKGQRLLANNRLIQAREQFRRAHLLDPMDPIPQILIAETYLSSGVKEELPWAIQLAESACRASKWTNPDAIETLIAAYQLNSELVKVELFTARLKEISNFKLILGSRKAIQSVVGLIIHCIFFF